MTTPSSIAHYRITAKLGQGGMGEVWRATDTKLNREVAIKVLPEGFAQDTDRMARFTREAQVLASLNHPNIAGIYGVEERALVMELAEGPTLAERLTQGPMPLAEALPIARQIAEALEYAHERGIIHRDLKPANIKITPEGRVKVLDFGLAKALSSDAPASDPVSSPTLTMRATQAGTIMGTAAYMSPEQAIGKRVDKRADIWSYGVVLWEMLTARRLFEGETVSHTLADVLRAGIDFGRLPVETPPAIRGLLCRCLDRDVKTRLRDIGEARITLDKPSEPAPVAAPVVTLEPPRRTWIPWLTAALPGLAFLFLAIIHFREPQPQSFETSLLPPPNAPFVPLAVNNGGFAISPDGGTLAFVATKDGRNMLWVRRLDSLSARPLTGTENGYYPFWSPDNRFLGFFAENKLKRVEVAGGPPQVVCATAASGRGGAWGTRGIIVFSGNDRTIYRVPAAGGEAVKITAFDAARQENGHYFPAFLPDGRHFLYMARSPNPEKTALCAGSIDEKPGSGKHIEVVKTLTNGFYVPDLDGGIWPRNGWLLFLRESTLFAQRFDPKALKLEGEAVPVAEQIGYAGNLLAANFSVSQNGVLAYGGSSSQNRRLLWFGRDGRTSTAAAEPAAYQMPRLSPDASRLAVTIIEPRSGIFDIWQIDLAHATTTRFTFDPTTHIFPVWSPDGKQIIFSWFKDGPGKLYLKAASGTGNEERLTQPSPAVQIPTDWSRDGRYIIYGETGESTGQDLFVLPLTGDRKPVAFLQTQFNEMQGQFSPDGRWVAYSSDESGRYEIYVRSFNGTPAKFQISQNGGMQPRWRGDGKELYFIAPDAKLMAVGVNSTADAFEREMPRALFPFPSLFFSGSAFQYDVTRDGQRFLAVTDVEHSEVRPLTLVTNWQAGLKK